MARRASYSYERVQRDRAKVAKREAKRAARAARKSGEAPEPADPHESRPVPESTVLRFSSDDVAEPEGTPEPSDG